MGQGTRIGMRLGLAAAMLGGALCGPACRQGLAAGLVVELLEKGAGERAGLRSGDVLLSFLRVQTVREGPASGPLSSPFELVELEREQAPRGLVLLFGAREGLPLSVAVPQGEWRFRARPWLDEADRGAHAAARGLLQAQRVEEGLGAVRRLAGQWAARGDHERAAWLLHSIGRFLIEGSRVERSSWAAAQPILEAAVAEAHTAVRPWAAAWVMDDCLRILYSMTGQNERVIPMIREVLEIRRRLAPESFSVAWSFELLGHELEASDLGQAEQLYKQSLEMRRKLAPGSLQVAASLALLANVAMIRGDYAAAERLARQGLEIRQKLAPQDLPTAEAHSFLAALAWKRGDLDAAERGFRQALQIREEMAPGTFQVARGVSDLGLVALDRGDLETAEQCFRRGLEIQERMGWDEAVAANLNNLGEVAHRRGDLEAAVRYHQRSLQLRERLAPDSEGLSNSLISTAELDLERGKLAEAESAYRRALAIRQRLAPGSALEAEACHGLGSALRRAGRREEAAAFFLRAVQALEAQVDRLGGRQEVRAGFLARHVDYDRDAIDLEVELGHPGAALELLERSRARVLRSMLAERDVQVSELPPELEARQKSLEADYDRTQAQLAELEARQDDAAAQSLQGRLAELREQMQQLRAELRQRWPQLAEPRARQPLGLTGVQQALDPGTVLLAYSVGRERSNLFVVRAAARPQDRLLEVHTLPAGEAALRQDVEALRTLMDPQAATGAGTALCLLQARLGAILLDPARAAIDAADRILLVPDGPLYLLPFAALAYGGGEAACRATFERPQLLIQNKPLHIVVSATVYAEFHRPESRPASAPQPQQPQIELAAFGDPRYPELPLDRPETVPDQQLRSALIAGLQPRPLPGSRREVEQIAAGLGARAAVYLGAEATEENARAAGRHARRLHFACHAFFNERSPLDSALVLSIPERPGEGRDNGLLQAWEIFERLRLDADLVVLSACETAVGKEAGGEGLLGLTHAFEYAGARSIVASLWKVQDTSTARLMERFYAQLRAGQPKDRALQAAQLELLDGRGPARALLGLAARPPFGLLLAAALLLAGCAARRPELRRPALLGAAAAVLLLGLWAARSVSGAASDSTTHPAHWAAFQLIGDWR